MQQSGSLMGMLLPLAVFVVIFYFLIIRPQKKRQRKHEEMIAAIRRGDQIVTAGGFFGVVTEMKDDSFILEVADGVKVRVLKSSIQMKRVEGEQPVESSGKKEKAASEEKKEQ